MAIRADAGRDHQRILRSLTADPEAALALVDLAPVAIRELVRNDITASLAPLRLPQSTPSPMLPAWVVREPLATTELLAHYQAASVDSGIGWEYLAAINLVETRMGRIVGESISGAVGPMQFLPTTWDACCDGDPWNDRDAIAGAATYLVRRGGPADMRRAILGYNPSEPYLEAVTSYADNLRRAPELYVGYHAWEVYVRTTAGVVRITPGYRATEPIDPAEYLRRHPEAAA